MFIYRLDTISFFHKILQKPRFTKGYSVLETNKHSESHPYLGTTEEFAETRLTEIKFRYRTPRNTNLRKVKFNVRTETFKDKQKNPKSLAAKKEVANRRNARRGDVTLSCARDIPAWFAYRLFTFIQAILLGIFAFCRRFVNNYFLLLRLVFVYNSRVTALFVFIIAWHKL